MRAVLVLGLLLAQAAGASTAPSFDGRWRLTDTVREPASVAEELLVDEVASSARLSIQQRFPDGARFANFTIHEVGPTPGRTTPPSPSRALLNTAVRRGRELSFRTGGAVRTAVAPGGLHEETWSLGTDNLLVVTVTNRTVGGAPTASRLTYKRVPKPESVAPEQNLVDNGTADRNQAFWSKSGDSATEKCDGNPCFVVRNSGGFSQTVVLPRDVAGKSVAIVGSASTERINADGGITGLPSLYATVGTADHVRIVGHLQGMLGRPKHVNAWLTVSGVFVMPADAWVLSLNMRQASAKGVPHNGSAVRFDNLGVHVFPSDADARAFVGNWRGR